MKLILKALGITIICLIAIITLICLLLIRSSRMKMENIKLVEGYPAKVKEHLEEKYGKSFLINPKYEFRPSGPIPGDTSLPYIYEVQEDGEEGYIFLVYVYPKSPKDKNIKEIRDGYCWKFIGEKAKDFLIEEMNEILPDEYKAIILPNSAMTFGNHIQPESPMSNSFSSVESGLIVKFYIITPPIDDLDYEEFSDESLYEILNGFYRNYISNANGGFIFYHCETETYDDYLKVNEKEVEGKIFPISNKDIYIWPVYITEKMEIRFGFD